MGPVDRQGHGATHLTSDGPSGDDREEAQIDFGLMGTIVYEDVRRKLWVLIVTLTASPYQFVWPTFTQTVEDVCAGLDAAWAFFGGIVQRIVPDNASSMVIRADAQSPTLNKSFAEYTQARGLFADPARLRRPQDKARVENQVPYVRERWFDGEVFHGDIVAIREMLRIGAVTSLELESMARRDWCPKTFTTSTRNRRCVRRRRAPSTSRVG